MNVLQCNKRTGQENDYRTQEEEGEPEKELQIKRLRPNTFLPELLSRRRWQRTKARLRLSTQLGEKKNRKTQDTIRTRKCYSPSPKIVSSPIRTAYFEMRKKVNADK